MDLTDEQLEQLATLTAGFDLELARETAAMLEGWADQTESYLRDGSINPRGKGTPEEYRHLARLLNEHGTA